MGTETLVVRRVDYKGDPASPDATRATYGNDIGCIVRDTVNINTRNLRAKVNRHVHNLLLTKVHARFAFPENPTKS